MVEKARDLIRFYGFEAHDSNCAIEAKPPVQWNKGDFFSYEYFQINMKFMIFRPCFNLYFTNRFWRRLV